jgi:hypothetical protein
MPGTYFDSERHLRALPNNLCHYAVNFEYRQAKDSRRYSPELE